MRLYDATASPNCRKVRVAARELGLALEIVPVDIAGPRPTGYLSQNPTGKVPTLVDDDGFVLWESGAILMHLAEKRPEAGLWPAGSPARAETLRWLFFAATHIQPWVSLLGQERVLKPRHGQRADPAHVALGERELGRFLPILDEALMQRDFLAGSYTIADISVGCGLEGCEARGVDLAPVPHVRAWRERLRRRPAWKD